MDYKVSKHSVYNINYHIVFCPKRRKAVLVDDLAIDLEKNIRETCGKLGCDIHALTIQPDHVHIFLSASPALAPHRIIKNLKGRSAHELRPKYKILQKLPAMWSRSYYLGTVGFVSDSIIKHYIENQKGK